MSDKSLWATAGVSMAVLLTVHALSNIPPSRAGNGLIAANSTDGTAKNSKELSGAGLSIRLVRVPNVDRTKLRLLLEFQCRTESVSVFNPWMQPLFPFSRSIRFAVSNEDGKFIRFLEDRVHTKVVDLNSKMWVNLHGEGSYLGTAHDNPLYALWEDPSLVLNEGNAKPPTARRFIVEAVAFDFLLAESIFDECGKIVPNKLSNFKRKYSGREIGRSNPVTIVIE